MTDKPLQISWEVIEQAMRKPLVVQRRLQAPMLPPGVLPEGANDWALDSPSCRQMYEYANAQGCYAGFMGYPYLAQLIQRSEYREPSATIASEMTRKWVKLASSEESDRIAELTEIMEQFEVREHFRKLIEGDGYFGRSQLYIALKGQDNKLELPLCVDPSGIKVGMLEGFRTIEPMWTSPQTYNSTDPTRPDFYRPSTWYVQGRRIHSDRLLTFVSREVPDLLKPAYNFGGLSLTQLIEPYVIQWLRTRDAVSDLIHNFSVLWLKTDMDAILEGGDGAELFRRIQLFIANRDNRGLMAIDMNREELGMTNAPLASLDKLQAQAQEHLAGPTHIPLVKLWGITPAGLNANSDGEIRVFYDWIDAQWKAHFARHLKTVLDVLQLNRWGNIDQSIRAIPEPLMQPSAVEQADIRKKNAETANVYVTMGAIDRAEVREQVANDPESGYQNLPVDQLPEDPMEKEVELQAGKPQPKKGGWLEKASDAAVFNEADHPRDYAGKFGSGGTSGPAVTKANSIEPTGSKSAKRIEPLHEVENEQKFVKLVAAMELNGWEGRPIPVFEGVHGTMALTGSHRIAAAREAGIEVPIYEVEGLGDFEDSQGRTITDVAGFDADEMVKFLKEFGDKDAIALAEAEAEEIV